MAIAKVQSPTSGGGSGGAAGIQYDRQPRNEWELDGDVQSFDEFALVLPSDRVGDRIGQARAAQAAISIILSPQQTHLPRRALAEIGKRTMDEVTRRLSLGQDRIQWVMTPHEKVATGHNHVHLRLYGDVDAVHAVQSLERDVRLIASRAEQSVLRELAQNNGRSPTSEERAILAHERAREAARDLGQAILEGMGGEQDGRQPDPGTEAANDAAHPGHTQEEAPRTTSDAEQDSPHESRQEAGRQIPQGAGHEKAPGKEGSTAAGGSRRPRLTAEHIRAAGLDKVTPETKLYLTLGRLEQEIARQGWASGATRREFRTALQAAAQDTRTSAFTLSRLAQSGAQTQVASHPNIGARVAIALSKESADLAERVAMNPQTPRAALLSIMGNGHLSSEVQNLARATRRQQQARRGDVGWATAFAVEQVGERTVHLHTHEVVQAALEVLTESHGTQLVQDYFLMTHPSTGLLPPMTATELRQAAQADRLPFDQINRLMAHRRVATDGAPFHPYDGLVERQRANEILARVAGELEHLEQTGHIVAVGPPHPCGYVRAEQAHQELDIAALVLNGQGTQDGIMEPAAARAYVTALSQDPQRTITLTNGQHAAILLALSSRDTWTGIIGHAGTGKTTAMKEIYDAAMKAGWEVQGIVKTHKAAEVLTKESGIPSRTFARFLLDQGKLALTPGAQSHQKVLLVIDEASLTSTDDLHKIALWAAASPDRKVLLVGDYQQTPAIAAGSPLKMLVEMGMQVQELTEAMRFKSPVLRNAATLIQQGRVGEAIALLRETGHVKTVAQQQGRVNQVVRDYMGRDPAMRRQTTIITAFHSEGARIAQQIQSELKRTGELRGTGVDIVIARPSDATDLERRWKDPAEPAMEARKLYEGDRIRFTANKEASEKGQGTLREMFPDLNRVAGMVERVIGGDTAQPRELLYKNGQMATVLKVNASTRSAIVQIDEVDGRPGKIIRLSLDNTDHTGAPSGLDCELGYYKTGHTSIGDSIVDVILSLGVEGRNWESAATREELLQALRHEQRVQTVVTQEVLGVMGTRAKVNVTVYVDNPDRLEALASVPGIDPSAIGLTGLHEHVDPYREQIQAHHLPRAEPLRGADADRTRSSESEHREDPAPAEAARQAHAGSHAERESQTEEARREGTQQDEPRQHAREDGPRSDAEREAGSSWQQERDRELFEYATTQFQAVFPQMSVADIRPLLTESLLDARDPQGKIGFLDLKQSIDRVIDREIRRDSAARVAHRQATIEYVARCLAEITPHASAADRMTQATFIVNLSTMESGRIHPQMIQRRLEIAREQAAKGAQATQGAGSGTRPAGEARAAGPREAARTHEPGAATSDRRTGATAAGAGNWERGTRMHERAIRTAVGSAIGRGLLQLKYAAESLLRGEMPSLEASRMSRTIQDVERQILEVKESIGVHSGAVRVAGLDKLRGLHHDLAQLRSAFAAAVGLPADRHAPQQAAAHEPARTPPHEAAVQTYRQRVTQTVLAPAAFQDRLKAWTSADQTLSRTIQFTERTVTTLDRELKAVGKILDRSLKERAAGVGRREARTSHDQALQRAGLADRAQGIRESLTVVRANLAELRAQADTLHGIYWQAHTHTVRQPGVTARELQQLTKTGNVETRVLVAGHVRTNATTLTRLGADRDQQVRAAVAANPQTPPRVLARLATDGSVQVRAAVSRNPNTAREVVDRLATRDVTSIVRTPASAELARRAAAARAQGTPRSPEGGRAQAGTAQTTREPQGRQQPGVGHGQERAEGLGQGEHGPRTQAGPQPAPVSNTIRQQVAVGIVEQRLSTVAPWRRAEEVRHQAESLVQQATGRHGEINERQLKQVVEAAVEASPRTPPPRQTPEAPAQAQGTGPPAEQSRNGATPTPSAAPVGRSAGEREAQAPTTDWRNSLSVTTVAAILRDQFPHQSVKAAETDAAKIVAQATGRDGTVSKDTLERGIAATLDRYGAKEAQGVATEKVATALRQAHPGRERHDITRAAERIVGQSTDARGVIHLDHLQRGVSAEVARYGERGRSAPTPHPSREGARALTDQREPRGRVPDERAGAARQASQGRAQSGADGERGAHTPKPSQRETTPQSPARETARDGRHERGAAGRQAPEAGHAKGVAREARDSGPGRQEKEVGHNTGKAKEGSEKAMGSRHGSALPVTQRATEETGRHRAHPTETTREDHGRTPNASTQHKETKGVHTLPAAQREQATQAHAEHEHRTEKGKDHAQGRGHETGPQRPGSPTEKGKSQEQHQGQKQGQKSEREGQGQDKKGKEGQGKEDGGGRGR